MNHHCARVELSAEGAASTAKPNLINKARFIRRACCYRAAAELNSSCLVRHGAARRMNWALINDKSPGNNKQSGYVQILEKSEKIVEGIVDEF